MRLAGLVLLIAFNSLVLGSLVGDRWPVAYIVWCLGTGALYGWHLRPFSSLRRFRR